MADFPYLNFDLLIERWADRTYRARAIDVPAGDAPPVQFTLPFDEAQLKRFFWLPGRLLRALYAEQDPRLQEHALLSPEEFGTSLFETVFAGELGILFRNSLQTAQGQNAGLRLRLRLSDALELADLPWEMLYAPALGRFLALSDQTPIVRYWPAPQPREPLEVSPPLRILAVVSNPQGVRPLKVEEEWARLRQALGGLEEGGSIELERLVPPTVNALQDRLRDQERGLHVLHFIGHGEFHAETGRGGLVFEDGAGQKDVVSAENLATLLYNHRSLRLAFLNACEGGKGGGSEPFAGVAHKLVQQGVPAVVAMQVTVTDQAALDLAHEFYEALADYYPLDAALTQARVRVKVSGNELEWATPVLFSRAPDNLLFRYGGALVKNVFFQGAEVAVPSPRAVAEHRAALRQHLEADARARWGGMALYIQEEGASLPIDASPYQAGRLGPRQNLLQALHEADRLLVLGDPGSGKTVALERLAWEQCAGPDPAIPLLVRLFHYAGTPLQDWVRSLLQSTGHLRLDDDRALTAFLKEGDVRCTFLFDGLNEVAPPYRDQLVDELVRWLAEYPDHAVILTSRAQDELWRRLRGEVGQALVMQRIEDEQARAYLIAHLGRAEGRALYNQLDPRLQEMASIPLILWLIKEAGAAAESVPGNRGELYARFVSRMLRRDTDRRMDAEIPERIKHQALADLAYSLGLDQRLTCRRDEAVEIVAGRLGEDQAEAVLGACARHGLLAGEEMVWYAPHQTVQEHFAAIALRELAEEEWELGRRDRLWLSVRRLAGRPEGLAALAAEDWWMETFVQLAGLVEDADRLARDVAQTNPWLAWWCVGEGREVSDATRARVEERSVRVLGSARTGDRRRAVQALAKFQSERTIPPLLGAAADADAEVAGLAVQALVGLGEAAREHVAGALRGTDRDLWLAALRYLASRPSDDPLCAEVPDEVWQDVLGMAMVWVPPGSFWMGSDKEKDSQASDPEIPFHEITLPGYWIGRYPVTVAQFRTFVQQSGYKPDDSDSLKGPDDHPMDRVTWHDALAYCRWLAENVALPVSLPSEAEWEKAARGNDGRIYPWGNEPPDEGRCNFGGKVGRTTPVGHYSPKGDSPYGCADMVGNVWEWTRSIYRDYRDDQEDRREDLAASNDVLRVLRGGSFRSYRGIVRCAYRLWDFPVDGLRGRGFRVCVAAQQD